MLFVSIASFSQTFEGEIVYANSYQSKNPQLTDVQWNSMLGTMQNYIIKNGDYKSSSDGNLMQWQLYINKDNKLYSKMSNSEIAFWNDGNVQGDEIVKAEINKNATEILGYKCDELILTCKSGIQKYYYNTKFAVDPKVFKNHKFGNWYDFVSRSNALPLKMIIENIQFVMTSVAVDVKNIKIEADVFTLPIGIKTEKVLISIGNVSKLVIRL